MAFFGDGRSLFLKLMSIRITDFISYYVEVEGPSVLRALRPSDPRVSDLIVC